MLSEQLTREEQKDKELLAQIRGNEELWLAFQRLLARKNNDAIKLWTDAPAEKPIKKAWLKGYRDCLGELLGDIEQTAEDAKTLEDEGKHEREIRESHAADGLGSGDLAIA